MRSRPVFLNLLKIKLPLAAFISIMHRVSGVVFFIGFPLLLYMYSLLPLANELQEFIANSLTKLSVWAIVSMYVYHFFAGVRHMVADFGHDHSLGRANQSAIAVLAISVIFSVWAGVLIW